MARGATASLRGLHIAHNDLQHGNVMVQRNGDIRPEDYDIRLVDYDGIFLPQFRGDPSPELGHKNYQHPLRSARDYDGYIDNFPSLVIYLSLLALAADPGLWSLFYNEDNLLFTRDDYTAPGRSDLFQRLRNSPDETARSLTGYLHKCCSLPIEQVPDLETILREGLPAQAILSPPAASQSPATSSSYRQMLREQQAVPASDRIDRQDFVQFCHSLDGHRLTTLSRGAGFKVRSAPPSVNFIPESTGNERRCPEPEVFQFLDQFERTGSWTTGDYTRVTSNASYLLAVLRRYLDTHPQPATQRNESAQARPSTPSMAQDVESTPPANGPTAAPSSTTPSPTRSVPCPNCNHSNPSTAGFCTHCGSVTRSGTNAGPVQPATSSPAQPNRPTNRATAAQPAASPPVSDGIDRQDFVRFCHRLDGHRLTTRYSGSGFRVRSAPPDIYFTLESSGIEWRCPESELLLFLEHFEQTRSWNPGDYMRVTRSSSYLVVILRRYLYRRPRLAPPGNAAANARPGTTLAPVSQNVRPVPPGSRSGPARSPAPRQAQPASPAIKPTPAQPGSAQQAQPTPPTNKSAPAQPTSPQQGQSTPRTNRPTQAQPNRPTNRATAAQPTSPQQGQSTSPTAKPMPKSLKLELAISPFVLPTILVALPILIIIVALVCTAMPVGGGLAGGPSAVAPQVPSQPPSSVVPDDKGRRLPTVPLPGVVPPTATPGPTPEQTIAATPAATPMPTLGPTPAPTASPTPVPTLAPTATLVPTVTPSPTASPTTMPTTVPTAILEPTTTPRPTPKPTAAPSSMPEWWHYTNDSYGYIVPVPPNWTVDARNPQAVRLTSPDGQASMSIVGHERAYPSFGAFADVVVNARRKDLGDRFELRSRWQDRNEASLGHITYCIRGSSDIYEAIVTGLLILKDGYGLEIMGRMHLGTPNCSGHRLDEGIGVALDHFSIW